MKKLVLLFLLLTLAGCSNVVDIYDDAKAFAIENYDNVHKVSCLSPAYFVESERYDLVQDKKGLCFIIASNEGGEEELHFYGSQQNTKKAAWIPLYEYTEIEGYVNEFDFRYHGYYYQYVYTLDRIVLTIDIKNNNDLFVVLDEEEPIYYEVDFKTTEEMKSIYTYYKEVDLARFLRNLRP